jgi:hypothetical protein
MILKVGGGVPAAQQPSTPLGALLALTFITLRGHTLVCHMLASVCLLGSQKNANYEEIQLAFKSIP